MSTALQVAEALLGIRALMLRRVDAALAPKGLSFAKFKLLQLIEQTGPCKASVLAAAIGQAPPTITEAVDAMEREELVVRNAHPTDRRARVIAITGKGRKTLREADGPKLAEVSAIFSVLTPAKQAQLLRLLKEVQEGM